MFIGGRRMPKLIPISHRELARKLKRAGFVVIRTSRHPVYYHAEKDLTVPIPSHPGDVPKETLRNHHSRNGFYG
jgi:predicted RNA binding protein YcfA (HicA-like mRNA interferase family)